MSRFVALLATFGMVLAVVVGIVGPASTATAGGTTDQSISAKALDSHECDSTEWHFVITQVDVEAHAPISIHVTWANGQSADVPLDKYTGGVAHYTTTLNLNSKVASATAKIYSGWSGEFNLSHGPCDNPTKIAIPATPSSTDACGPNNATWNVPADTAALDWTLMPNGHLVVTIIAPNTVFTDGTTTHDYGVVTDSNTPCPTHALPGTATATSGACVYEGQSTGVVSVTVINTDDPTNESVTYTITVNGVAQTLTIVDGAGGTWNFPGLTSGTFNWSVTGPDGTNVSGTVTVGKCVLVTVTSLAPKKANRCGWAHDRYWIPSQADAYITRAGVKQSPGWHKTYGAMRVNLRAHATDPVNKMLVGQVAWHFKFHFKKCNPPVLPPGTGERNVVHGGPFGRLEHSVR